MPVRLEHIRVDVVLKLVHLQLAGKGGKCLRVL